MCQQSELLDIFIQLKNIMSHYSNRLNCVKDLPGDYFLNTQFIMKNKKPLFFGAVQVRKAYLSYHLMPVYVFPELLENISLKLKNRMHGKSCFNFKKVDELLFEELAQLTDAGFKMYKKEGYI